MSKLESGNCKTNDEQIQGVPEKNFTLSSTSILLNIYANFINIYGKPNSIAF